MTDSQWLLEYSALRQKEKENTDTIVDVIKAMQTVLVKVLGLDLLRSETDDKDTFIPLSILAGRREVVTTIMDKMKQQQAIVDSQASINDDDFEKISAAVASGDIEPLDRDDIGKLFSVTSKSNEEYLKSIGVNIVDRHDSDNVSHLNIGGSRPNKVQGVEFDDDA